MTRPLTMPITITGALAGALLIYRTGGWEFADAVTPAIRIIDALGALVTWMMLIDQRRADHYARRMQEIDAIEQLAERYRSARVDDPGGVDRTYVPRPPIVYTSPSSRST